MVLEETPQPTLATVGFGDLVAGTNLGRMLAVMAPLVSSPMMTSNWTSRRRPALPT